MEGVIEMKKKTFREKYGSSNAINQVVKEITELIRETSKPKKTRKTTTKKKEK